MPEFPEKERISFSGFLQIRDNNAHKNILVCCYGGDQLEQCTDPTVLKPQKYRPNSINHHSHHYFIQSFVVDGEMANPNGNT